jgi:hypothetical protein
MTNLDAIKSMAIGYPIDEATYNRILIDRGVDAAGTYAGKSKAMELAKADLYVTLLTAANITEGGYQLSLTDKTNFKQVASGIYDLYREPNPLKEARPQVKAIRPW